MTYANPQSSTRRSNRRSNSGPRTLALVAAAVTAVAGAFATRADAQYRVDNGQARDANNRVGSGGFNSTAGGGPVQQRVGGDAGNYIVTGNVTGGRAFRGALGYTDPSSFRGNLGSASFDNFYRDSVGGGGRGLPGSNNNYATIQPYFGPGRTVAPPAGFVQDPNRGGGYVVAPRQIVQPNDARLDYGGASNAQVVQGYANSARVIGGAGLYNANSYANGNFGYTGSGIAPFDVSAGPASAYQLSEYTSLARAEPNRLAQAPGTGSLTSPSGLNRLQTIYQNNGATPPTNANGPTALDPNTVGTTVDANVNSRLDNTTQLPADGLNDPADAAAPNQRAQFANNSQYAELHRRLDAADRTRRLPGSDAVDQANRNNAALIEKRNKANGTDTNANPNDPNANPTGTPGGVNTTGRQDDRVGSGRQTDQRVPAGRVDDRVTPAGGTQTTPGGMNNAGGSPLPTLPGGPGMHSPTSQPATPRDTLNLPRPADATAANNPARPATTQPGGDANDRMEIHSLATGVRDPALADSLKRAEALMKDGKFATAIDTYERAGTAANSDPIVFMGRSIAELGGSYYRRAETHLRQAFAGDRALTFAKFDLRGLLGNDRLNFLVNDLNEVARTNPHDPGPLLLLSFIYYNTGIEDKAARALVMAQTRAGGNDPTVTLLQQTWKLPAQAGGAGEDSTK